MTAVVFTDHALVRYRRRIPADQRVDLRVLVEAGEIRDHVPLTMLEPADAFLVHGEAVFVLHLCHGDLVAVTCLRRRRRLKADIRAFREQTRDPQAAA